MLVYVLIYCWFLHFLSFGIVSPSDIYFQTLIYNLVYFGADLVSTCFIDFENPVGPDLPEVSSFLNHTGSFVHAFDHFFVLFLLLHYFCKVALLDLLVHEGVLICQSINLVLPYFGLYLSHNQFKLAHTLALRNLMQNLFFDLFQLGIKLSKKVRDSTLEMTLNSLRGDFLHSVDLLFVACEAGIEDLF